MNQIKKNRNPVKQLFITFPKSNVDKTEFRDALLQFQPEFYYIVEEKHKDGTPHLHAVIYLKNPYSYSHVAKKLAINYPNDYKRIDVSPVRSIEHALKYLSKEDEKPLTTGPFKSKRDPVGNANLKIINDVTNGNYKSTEDFVKSKQEEDNELLRLEQVYLEWAYDYYKITNVHPKSNKDIPYEIKKIMENIEYPKYPILIDDITKLLKFIKIPY